MQVARVFSSALDSSIKKFFFYKRLIQVALQKAVVIGSYVERFKAVLFKRSCH